jgi:hypothetical protein
MPGFDDCARTIAGANTAAPSAIERSRNVRRSIGGVRRDEPFETVGWTGPGDRTESSPESAALI